MLSNLRYVNECFYKPKKHKKEYYAKTLKIILLSYITRWGRKNKLALPDTTIYSIIHQPFMNYFHWIIESLTRLIILENNKTNSQLIIPGNLYKLDYIKNSLSLLGIANFQIIEGDRLLFVKRLALPGIVRWGGNYDPLIMLQLRNRLLEGFNTLNKQYSTYERLFVERSGRRRIKNFEEIKSMLEKYRFQTFDFGKISFYEQIGIMQKVKVLVAQSGSELTNMLFMPPKSTIIEIRTNQLDSKQYVDYSNWLKMSSCLGHKHYFLFADSVNDVQNIWADDCYVDTSKLEDLITKILIHKT